MNVSLVVVPAQWVAYRIGSASFPNLGRAIQDALGPIYGLEGVSGTPYARYLERRGGDCDFQAGVLLRGRVAPSGDIVVDRYPACRAVCADYRGTYEGRDRALAAAEAYVLGEGLVRGGPMWEVFDGPPDAEGIASVRVYLPVEPSP